MTSIEDIPDCAIYAWRQLFKRFKQSIISSLVGMAFEAASSRNCSGNVLELDAGICIRANRKRGLRNFDGGRQRAHTRLPSNSRKFPAPSLGFPSARMSELDVRHQSSSE